MSYLVAILPWILSAITIWMTVMAGNRHRSAWLIGLVNQGLWFAWIVMTGTWGLLPMNLALWFVYGRNHFKWKTDTSGSDETLLIKLQSERADKAEQKLFDLRRSIQRERDTDRAACI